MVKDTSISIRIDSQLKEQTENILEQFGLNMTSVVNMLFRQIVRERAIPLSLKLNPRATVLEELNLAKTERLNGSAGRNADDIADSMESIIAEVENA